MKDKGPILYLMRHAHSPTQWGVHDVGRILDHIGKKQALHMGKMLSKKNFFVEKIIASSSDRTKQTAQIIKDALLNKPMIFLEQGLYRATTQEVIQVVHKYGCSDNIMIVGHNPSITETLYYFCNKQHFFAPCDVALLRARYSSLSEAATKENGFSLIDILSSCDIST